MVEAKFGLGAMSEAEAEAVFTILAKVRHETDGSIRPTRLVRA
jgi:hypothetical protein